MQANKHETQEDLWAYNCRDCTYTRECGEAEAKALIERQLVEVDAFQQRLFFPVLNCMIRGVRVDLKEKARLSTYLQGEIDRRQTWLDRVCDHPLNVNSSKQMKALFYDDFKLPVVWKRTPGGKVATLDDSAIDLLKGKELITRPIFRKIQELRAIKKMKSDWAEMRLDEDLRARTSYNICGTKTYRFSSSENAFGTGRNLQNVTNKKGDDESDIDLDLPDVRGMFIPDEGYEWFDVDLSKADLRTVVWESNCLEMKSMLAEGRDPYIETAREFYRDPTITKILPNGTVNKKYQDFKSFGHGTHFLGTPQGLAQRIGLTVHEATRTQNWYLQKYPEIKKWQEAFCEEVRRTHRVQNRFGYTFDFFGRIDDSTFREAIAWIPQSTTGCVINRIWLNIHDRYPDLLEVLLQVHDSLDLQAKLEDHDKAIDALEECGKVVVPYEDPLIIPVGIKSSTKSWGQCA